ncbi:Hypothetical protein KVN_LOCUS130 [uncultured virus]|nr:Hypothetical protein KVN_LOCUS130 [uncultured virus]
MSSKKTLLVKKLFGKSSTNINKKLKELKKKKDINQKDEELKYIPILTIEKVYYFINTDTIYKFLIPVNVKNIFLTMIGGGGAGGIGYVQNYYYYSGGGGGAGAYLIKKPIAVNGGEIVSLKVGKGGIATQNEGEESYIIIILGNIQNKYSIEGGKNGNPSTIFRDNFLNGGSGGISGYSSIQDGESGYDGEVNLPSQPNANGGNGANSYFGKGGTGGYFNEENIISLIGKDGSYGSGGGGSSPRTNFDLNSKLSGNGGDGFILIEMI